MTKEYMIKPYAYQKDRSGVYIVKPFYVPEGMLDQQRPGTIMTPVEYEEIFQQEYSIVLRGEIGGIQSISAEEYEKKFDKPFAIPVIPASHVGIHIRRPTFGGEVRFYEVIAPTIYEDHEWKPYRSDEEVVFGEMDMRYTQRYHGTNPGFVVVSWDHEVEEVVKVEDNWTPSFWPPGLP